MLARTIFIAAWEVSQPINFNIVDSSRKPGQVDMYRNFCIVVCIQNCSLWHGCVVRCFAHWKWSFLIRGHFLDSSCVISKNCSITNFVSALFRFGCLDFPLYFRSLFSMFPRCRWISRRVLKRCEALILCQSATWEYVYIYIACNPTGWADFGCFWV